MAKNLIDIWFVANPDTQKVEQILMLGPLGMSKREGQTWKYTAKEDADLESMTGMKIYDYDWSSDKDDLPDNFTEEDLTPESVKKFDGGDLSISDLDGAAELLYDGTSEG